VKSFYDSVRSLYINICFLTITISFFLYNYAIFEFNMTPFLGGYFTLMTLCLLPFLVILSSWKYSGFECLYLSGYLYFSLLGGYFYLTHKELGGFEFDMLKYTIVGVFNNIFIFYLFRNMNYLVREKTFFLVTISLCFICYIMLINIGAGFVFNPRASNGDISTYLIFSFIYILLYVYLLSFLYAFKSRFFTISLIIGLLFLFIAGSKANFIFFVFSAVVLYLYVGGFSISNAFKVLFMGLFLFSLLLLFWYYAPESRIFQILSPTTDRSTMYRFEGILYALEVIGNNIFLGDYGAYVIKYDAVSAYPHNILSAWVNNGILGVLFFVAIYSYIFLYIILKRRRILKYIAFDSVLRFLFFYFSIFLSLSFFKLMFSDQYLTMYFSIMVGIFISFRSRFSFISKKYSDSFG
jgi:hypothetical protein